MPSPSTVLLRTQSDERLVALARSGHDRAFEAIVERYRRALLRACRRILPEARAEDALQQALIAAWAGLRRGDDVAELRPWLFRIVRNTALNQLRLSGYDFDELVETLSAADDPEEEVVRRAVVRETLAAVAALPDRQREALLRTAIEGRAQADVARDLGLSSTAMRQLVHRARVTVRAAATAVVPMPAAAWLASAGGVTTTATLAKAGTLALLAGGAVTAPTLLDHRPVAPRDHAEVRADGHRASRRPQAPEAGPTPDATPSSAPSAQGVRTRSVALPPHDDHSDAGETRERDDGESRRNGRGGTRQSDERDDDGETDGRDERADDAETDDHDERADDAETSGGSERETGEDDEGVAREADDSGVKPPDDDADDEHGGDDASVTATPEPDGEPEALAGGEDGD